MGIFDFLRGQRRRDDPLGDGAAPEGVLEYLTGWASTRAGIEAFVEPRTFVDEPTILLVDIFGEWTRRRIGGREGVRQVREGLGIPVFDALVTGYPRRKREFDERRKILEDRARGERLRRRLAADRDEEAT